MASTPICYKEMQYGLKQVDYSQLPVNFDRYAPADQLRIITPMLTVMAAHRTGQVLRQAPLPLSEAPASLELGLAQLAQGEAG